MNEGKRVSPSSFRCNGSSLLQWKACPHDAPLEGNFAPLLAYDSGREREPKPRAARETFKRVAVRIGHGDSAPLDQSVSARRAGTFTAETHGRYAFVVCLRRRAPALCDILQSLS